MHDRTNVRELTPEQIGGPVDLVVADLSFISLHAGAAGAGRLHRADADLLPMVKPQFEVGRERLGAGGVVRDPAAAGRGGPHGRRPRRTSWGWAPRGMAAARCRGRPATWSSSSGCAGTRRRRRTRPTIAKVGGRRERALRGAGR